MTRYSIISCPSDAGSVTVYAAPGFRGSDRPVVVMVHGALRTAGVLAPWGELIAPFADLLLVDLPGHGRSEPIEPASVAAMAEAIDGALRSVLAGRRALLVGESIGGTIALAIGGLSSSGPIRAVFAADPPMTTAKLWSVAAGFRRQLSASPNAAFPAHFARDAFGFMPDRFEERIYYPLLGELKVPAVIATGDLALLPPRPLNGLTSVFDPVDQFVLTTFYADKVEFRQITDCGHLLLTDARPACLEIIQGLLAEHVAVA